MTDIPLVIVVGVQKSGTSLLNRLLQRTGLFTPLAPGEGDDFWGNQPPFSPTAEPTGRLRLERGADFGHELDAGHATPDVVSLMQDRLREVERRSEERPLAIVNKNPYLSVRLPWLRSIFPSAVVVAMVRRPEANVFSLSKKFVPHTGRGLPPEDSGWWGVKPAGWRDLLDPDPVRQCLGQWVATNERLLDTLAPRDVVMNYASLCRRPSTLLRYLVRLVGGADEPLTDIPEDLDSRDDEFRTGSTLRSKNRLFQKTGGFATPTEEDVEHAAFDGTTLSSIRAATGTLWSRLQARAVEPTAVEGLEK